MRPTSGRLAGAALAAWVVCFGVLARLGTWLPFAFAGTALTAVMLRRQEVSIALLRPSGWRIAAGVIGGAIMVGLTHVAYLAVSAAVPSVLPATEELFELLNVSGFSPPERAALIALIASCEEVLFRGPLLGSLRRDEKRDGWRLDWPATGRTLAFAAAYAVTTVPLANPLLLLCAFVCGSIWGALAIASGSLTVPILVHVIWDLGVLIVWPLPTRP